MGQKTKMRLFLVHLATLEIVRSARGYVTFFKNVETAKLFLRNFSTDDWRFEPGDEYLLVDQRVVSARRKLILSRNSGAMRIASFRVIKLEDGEPLVIEEKTPEQFEKLVALVQDEKFRIPKAGDAYIVPDLDSDEPPDITGQIILVFEEGLAVLHEGGDEENPPEAFDDLGSAKLFLSGELDKQRAQEPTASSQIFEKGQKILMLRVGEGDIQPDQESLIEKADQLSDLAVAIFQVRQRGERLFLYPVKSGD